MKRDELKPYVRSFQQVVAGFNVRGFSYDNEDIQNQYNSLLFNIEKAKQQLTDEETKLVNTLPTTRDFNEACLKVDKARKSKGIIFVASGIVVGAAVLAFGGFIENGAAELGLRLAFIAGFLVISILWRWYLKQFTKFDELIDYLANDALTKLYFQLKER